MSIVFIVLGVVIVLFILVSLGNGGNNSAAQNEPDREITEESIKELALSGRKIEAIKDYRTLYGLGLKDAKDAVEKMLDDN